MPTVFLSSVARGLEQYRDAVYRAIEGLDGYHCVRMEDFGARDQTPHSLCVDKVGSCDVFVGIAGHRYGNIAIETGKSFSESEYDAAVAAKKPRAIFLAPEEFPLPANLIEPDGVREKQANFRARISQDRTVTFFPTADALAGQVIQAMHNLRSHSVEEGTIVEGPTVTRLLFPFVTNQFGFDTGIAISNISKDPFGTLQQEGTCTVHCYGRLPDGTAPQASQTSSVVRAGEQLIFNLSSGGTGLIQAMPGFAGYFIVECRFKAAGFAFVSDVGAQRVASGYIAQIM
jgi:hypothetical protein